MAAQSNQHPPPEPSEMPAAQSDPFSSRAF